MRASPTGVLLLALLTGGCVSVVTPPASPEDPVTVHLVQEAWHKGILLPGADGSFTEWGYGDWGWYARNEDRWYDVFDTVLWPTPAALGRRDFGAAPVERVLGAYSHLPVIPIRLSRAGADALRARLESEWRRAEDTLVENAPWGLRLVRTSPGYWFLHNCNDEMAEWLREAGCEVSWVPIRLGLSVRCATSPADGPAGPRSRPCASGCSGSTPP